MKKRIPNAKQKTALLLLLAMLITTLPSCSPKKTGETDATSTKNIPAVEETTPEETEPPINITTEKFSGEDFNIAYMTGGSYGMGNEVDYTFEDSEASAVSSAVYERNLRTEEQLDIKINGEFINPTDAYVFNNYVMELVQSGDSSCDAILNYLRYNYWLVGQKGLINIAEVDSFALENAWWDKNVTDAFTFDDKLFFATGDICMDDDCSTQILLFNKDMHTQNGIALPYESVKNGTWTLDAMVSNMEVAYKDLNGDGVMDRNDRYGLNCGVGVYPEFMIYCNAPFTSINEEGYPEFSYTSNPDKLINTFDTIFNKLIVNPSVVVTEYDLGSDYVGARQMFSSNRFMYYAQAIGILQSLRDEMETDFGVIPGPKLDEQQDQYYSNGSMWASTYALPASTENAERAGAILNVMGYNSVDTIQKTIIETVVMNRNLRDEESEEMIKLVINNKIYDRAFTLDLGGIFSQIYNIVATETMTFVSAMKTAQSKFETDIADLIEAYKNN